MNEIKMVDLVNQQKAFWPELELAFQDLLETTAYIRGPQVAAFENQLANYLGIKHVIGCANGTDALQLALMALELPKGSEVIVPDFTFVATTEAIAIIGLVPVLVDVDPSTFCMDVDKARKAISPATRAIVPVHLFGQCAPMKEIMALAKEFDLFVIEDTAQALGADYCATSKSSGKAGTIGHIGTTSFFPSKNLGCMGDGGALFTNDDKLAAAIRKYANHGMDSQYEYVSFGINSRLDTLQAAFLSVKLPRLDGFNNSRRSAADFYTKSFEGIEAINTPVTAAYSSHIYHQYVIQVNNGQRDVLMKHLAELQIPTKVYYPQPIHESPAYAAFAKYDVTQLSTTKELCKSVLGLPMHTELSFEQLTYITSSVKNFFNSRP